MSVEDNKAVVLRLFDVWNKRDLDAIPELYSPDYVADYRPYAPLARGHDGIRAMIERAHTTFPDCHEELLGLVAEGDRVVVHLRITGTQHGQWGPIAPTGKPVCFEEMLLLRFADGKVVEQRGIVDNLLALRQIGVMPTPPTQRQEKG